MTDVSRALEARQAISDTLARFCERIDEYDIEGVTQLFADDCRTDYGPENGGVLRGRDAFRNRVTKSQAQFRRTHHQLGQIRVELQGDRASVVSYVTATHEFWDGGLGTIRFQYRDEMLEVDGSWLIAERVALATVVDGFDTIGWHWLDRQTPATRPSG